MKKLLAIFFIASAMLFGADFNKSLSKSMEFEGDRVFIAPSINEISKYGIKKETLDHFNKQYNTYWDVYSLKEKQARVIYYVYYWSPFRFDELPQRLANNVFDYTINSWTDNSIKDLQRVLNDMIRVHNHTIYASVGGRIKSKSMKYLSVDGRIGSRTIEMANHFNEDDIVRRYKIARLSYLKTLRNYKEHGRSWRWRISKL